MNNSLTNRTIVNQELSKNLRKNINFLITSYDLPMISYNFPMIFLDDTGSGGSGWSGTSLANRADRATGPKTESNKP